LGCLKCPATAKASWIKVNCETYFFFGEKLLMHNKKAVLLSGYGQIRVKAQICIFVQWKSFG